MSLIDLAAILPFYLPMFLPVDLRFMRVLRLFRLFRIFKIGKFSHSMTVLIAILKSKKEDLIITLTAGIILLIFASSLMYFMEHPVQPEAFPDIPAAMWWGVITLTTVGYGDVYPVTTIGKFFGAIIAFLGVGMFALPAGILASGFSEIIKGERIKRCPHCDKDI
jgi:voltage-gated potassium channel